MSMSVSTATSPSGCSLPRNRLLTCPMVRRHCHRALFSFSFSFFSFPFSFSFFFFHFTARCPRVAGISPPGPRARPSRLKWTRTRWITYPTSPRTSRQSPSWGKQKKKGKKKEKEKNHRTLIHPQHTTVSSLGSHSLPEHPRHQVRPREWSPEAQSGAQNKIDRIWRATDPADPAAPQPREFAPTPHLYARMRGSSSLEMLSGVCFSVTSAPPPSPYRSGKSFLLNQVAGNKAFEVGDTVRPETEEVRALVIEPCASDPTRTGTVMLLDTPGLFAPNRAPIFDAQLLAIVNLSEWHRRARGTMTTTTTTTTTKPKPKKTPLLTHGLHCGLSGSRSYAHAFERMLASTGSLLCFAALIAGRDAMLGCGCSELCGSVQHARGD